MGKLLLFLVLLFLIWPMNEILLLSTPRNKLNYILPCKIVREFRDCLWPSYTHPLLFFWLTLPLSLMWWCDVKSLSRVRLFVTPWTVAYQAPPSMGFSRQECWSGLPFPSPGDLPTQDSNLGLPHCRRMLYRLSHQGSLFPYKLANMITVTNLPAKAGYEQSSTIYSLGPLISY